MSKVKILCCECSLKLKKDEIALSKKMLGRDIVDFMCTDCLADYMSCSRSDLEVKIIEFKEKGCSLFL